MSNGNADLGATQPELVETIAKAILSEDYDLSEVAWGDIPEGRRQYFRDQAVAAIQAMREPPAHVIDAGATALVQRRYGCPPDDHTDACRIWRRMMDAALK